MNTTTISQEHLTRLQELNDALKNETFQLQDKTTLQAELIDKITEPTHEHHRGDQTGEKHTEIIAPTNDLTLQAKNSDITATIHDGRLISRETTYNLDGEPTETSDWEDLNDEDYYQSGNPQSVEFDEKTEQALEALKTLDKKIDLYDKNDLDQTEKELADRLDTLLDLTADDKTDTGHEDIGKELQEILYHLIPTETLGNTYTNNQ